MKVANIISTIILVFFTIMWGYWEYKKDKERKDNERDRDIK